MICDFPRCWSFLIYNGFNYHVNVTDTFNLFAEERIKVGKNEAGTSALNQEYDKLQANQDKDQTRQLLELARRKIHGRINQCQIIMIIYTAIHNITSKVWTDSFVAFNLHFHHRLYFSVWINNIAPAVKTGET